MTYTVSVIAAAVSVASVVTPVACRLAIGDATLALVRNRRRVKRG